MSTKPNQPLWRAGKLALTILMLLSLLFIVPAVHAQTSSVTVHIDSASINKLGVITVQVTVTCSEPATIGDPSANSMTVYMRQPYKRIYTIEGAGVVFLTECNGSTSYTVHAVANTGKFAAGITYLSANLQICDFDFNCVYAEDFLATRIH